MDFIKFGRVLVTSAIPGSIYLNEVFTLDYRAYLLTCDENFITLIVEHEPYGVYNSKESLVNIDIERVKQGHIKIENCGLKSIYNIKKGDTIYEHILNTDKIKDHIVKKIELSKKGKKIFLSNGYTKFFLFKNKHKDTQLYKVPESREYSSSCTFQKKQYRFFSTQKDVFIEAIKLTRFYKEVEKNESEH